jgi:hypothetical protein
LIALNVAQTEFTIELPLRHRAQTGSVLKRGLRKINPRFSDAAVKPYLLFAGVAAYELHFDREPLTFHRRSAERYPRSTVVSHP